MTSMVGKMMRGRDALLGTLDTAQFMARCWQRRAHLVRQALAVEAIPFARLCALAARDDVESRVVIREGREWRLEHGPFSRRWWRTLPARDWTLLVQGVDQHEPAARAALARFDFLPRARLDDVMVSYAVPGGGVGPHFDSYDVFLLQASGTRRWRVAAQRDLRLVEGAPLRILARFRPTREWIVAPGDLLYLPPRYAHDGVAVDTCTTWSVGFRAPRWRELLSELFAELPAGGIVDRLYEDAGARPTSHPGALPEAMVTGLADTLARLAFPRAALADAVGRTMSAPKAHVVFDRPPAPLSRARFAARLRSRGIALDPRTILLYRGEAIYANGEAERPPRAVLAVLRTLADRRALPAGPHPDPGLVAVLHDWYHAGWVHPG